MVGSQDEVRTPPQRVVARIRAGGPALVAMSGGVDSALVASLTFEALGDRALAVTLVGPAVAREEADRAGRVARAIGIAHVSRRVDPLARPEYRANPSNRCFFCRTVEAEVLTGEARTRGLVQLLDGVQLDDLGDDRPGLLAMNRAGFVHPLAESGYRKADVREEARRRGLPNWDEPSDACLSSRVRHGLPISEQLLGRIEQGEAVVRAAGFRRVRLRIEGEKARVEVDPDEVAHLLSEPVAARVKEEIARLGLGPVELDPVGYRRVRSTPVGPT